VDAELSNVRSLVNRNAAQHRRRGASSGRGQEQKLLKFLVARARIGVVVLGLVRVTRYAVKDFFSWLDGFLRAIGQFVCAIILQLTIPLLPLVAEYGKNHDVTVGSATVAAAMYAISIGVASDGTVLFTLGIAFSIVFSYAFGQMFGQAGSGGAAAAPAGLPLIMAGPDRLAQNGFWPILCIVFVFTYDFFQRILRHILRREPFLQFRTGR
jgi:hypothetical protein